ncbi:uncharacterized protein LOC110239221 [Exaiptasia diaphana]|uniref:O-acyltransferase WSD1 C-terminal domain-containing protein n=1 Tax=Exaiptasia diaphana TaxID=2652724 RepID=A0A913X8D3_EXADI|nr:uncharacterized protein LOC110239221 [Exaiptasia diaphana]KXJ14224.1 hypothetical protein AC249_AIPGENE20210 [Exaiptasia diaphana]
MSSASNSAWASPRLSDHNNEEFVPVSNISNNGILQPKPSSKIKRIRHPTDSFFLLRLCQLIVSFVLNATLFVLCLCLCLTVLPLVLFIRRIMETCCVKTNTRHGKLDTVNSLDAIWLSPTINNNSISSLFFLLEGHINVEELKELINDKWLHYCSAKKKYRFAKLRMCAVEVCSGFAWRKLGDLQTENFVCVSDQSGTEISAVEFLGVNSYIDEVNSNDPKRLWQVTVFPKFLDSEDSGILFQMHHSVCDIFPFARFVFESLEYKNVYLKDRCFPMHRLCLYFCTAFAGPLIVTRRLFHSKAKTILDQNNDCQYNKVLWSEAIDMKSVKKVKDISRTKVNVILMSCLAGALRSYFYMCGIDHPDDLRACIKIDTRPQHTKLRLDNHLSYVFVDLPSATEGAVPRLWDMRRRMEDFNSMIEGFAFFAFLRFCLILFPLSLARRVVDFLLGKASCTVTFLSGPNTPVYFNGKMAKYMTFWEPKPNSSGLSLSIATYGNHVRLGAVFHQEQPCDPQLLLTEFQKEVENLSKHLSQRTLPSHLRWRARQQILMQQDEKEGSCSDEPAV